MAKIVTFIGLLFCGVAFVTFIAQIAQVIRCEHSRQTGRLSGRSSKPGKFSSLAASNLLHLLNQQTARREAKYG